MGTAPRKEIANCCSTSSTAVLKLFQLWGGHRLFVVQGEEEPVCAGGRTSVSRIWSLSYSNKAVCLLLHLCTAWGIMGLSTSWKIPNHIPLSFTGSVSVWWSWPEPVLAGWENQCFSNSAALLALKVFLVSWSSQTHCSAAVGQLVSVPLCRWAGSTEGQEFS